MTERIETKNVAFANVLYENRAKNPSSVCSFADKSQHLSVLNQEHKTSQEKKIHKNKQNLEESRIYNKYNSIESRSFQMMQIATYEPYLRDHNANKLNQEDLISFKDEVENTELSSFNEETSSTPVITSSYRHKKLDNDSMAVDRLKPVISSIKPLSLSYNLNVSKEDEMQVGENVSYVGTPEMLSKELPGKSCSETSLVESERRFRSLLTRKRQLKPLSVKIPPYKATPQFPRNNNVLNNSGTLLTIASTMRVQVPNEYVHMPNNTMISMNEQKQFCIPVPPESFQQALLLSDQPAQHIQRNLTITEQELLTDKESTNPLSHVFNAQSHQELIQNVCLPQESLIENQLYLQESSKVDSSQSGALQQNEFHVSQQEQIKPETLKESSSEALQQEILQLNQLRTSREEFVMNKMQELGRSMENIQYRSPQEFQIPTENQEPVIHQIGTDPQRTVQSLDQDQLQNNAQEPCTSNQDLLQTVLQLTNRSRTMLQIAHKLQEIVEIKAQEKELRQRFFQRQQELVATTQQREHHQGLVTGTQQTEHHQGLVTGTQQREHHQGLVTGTQQREHHRGLVTGTQQREHHRGLVAETHQGEHQRGLVAETHQGEHQRGLVAETHQVEHQRGLMAGTRLGERQQELMAGTHQGELLQCVHTHKKPLLIPFHMGSSISSHILQS